MATILIAGANRGLGLEFVRQYAAAGDRVIAACRAPDRADALTALAASSKGRVTVHPLDVTDEASVQALKDVIHDQPIDIVIANAGVYGGNRQGWSDMDFGSWMRTLAVNTLGPLRVAQITHANLKAGKGKLFVAITSGMGSNTDTGGGMHAYRTSKAALNKLCNTLALDWHRDDIVVVPVSPGWAKTDMGGPGAPLTAEQSITAMRSFFPKLTIADSGHLFDYDGSSLSW